MQEAHQMLQLVLDTIPVRVFWKDIDLVIQGCNKPFANDVGFENPEGFIGKTDFDFPWAEHQAILFRSDDQRVMQSVIPKLNYEEPQIRPDGAKSWLNTSKVTLKDMDGVTIGIAICRKIVDRHGGIITAKSKPGQGAVFVVSLPVKQQSKEKQLPD